MTGVGIGRGRIGDTCRRCGVYGGDLVERTVSRNATRTGRLGDKDAMRMKGTSHEERRGEETGRCLDGWGWKR